MFSKVSYGTMVFATVTVFATMVAAPAEATDPLVGQTYSYAQGKIADWHGTAIVASVVGDVLDRDKCTVASWRKAKPLDGTGTPNGTTSYLLNLNCNLGVASAAGPGNSVATPEGKAAQYISDKATRLNNDPSWCEKNAKNHKNCADFCNKNDGLCNFTLS